MSNLYAILELRKEAFDAVSRKINDIMVYLSARGVDPVGVTEDVDGTLANLTRLQQGIDNLRAIAKLLAKNEKERLLQRLNREERKLHDLKVQLALLMRKPSDQVLATVQKLLTDLNLLLKQR